MSNGKPKSNIAVFLDRDGTINKDVPYCSKTEDFHLLPGVGESIRRLNESGFIAIIITNQSGISRGYFNHAILNSIHIKMQKDLALYNARIDAIYHCEHHPDSNCMCRKPKPTLILRAAKEHNISLQNSYVIGDSLSDIQAGKNAGCLTVLINTKKYAESEMSAANYICSNLSEGVSWIMNMRNLILGTKEENNLDNLEV